MASEKQKVRAKFRSQTFERDGHKCRFCDRTDDLDAHHIRDRSLMPNGGYVRANGITLCPDHHKLAERFHVSGGTEWEPDMHPDDLYRLIGSTQEQAERDSQRLA